MSGAVPWCSGDRLEEAPIAHCSCSFYLMWNWVTNSLVALFISRSNSSELPLCLVGSHPLLPLVVKGSSSSANKSKIKGGGIGSGLKWDVWLEKWQECDSQLMYEPYISVWPPSLSDSITQEPSPTESLLHPNLKTIDPSMHFFGKLLHSSYHLRLNSCFWCLNSSLHLRLNFT